MTTLAFQRHTRLFSATLTLALLVAACSAPPSAPGPDVWAVVDGRLIGKADVEKAHRSIMPPTETPPLEEDLLLAQLGTLDELITQDILLARARATGLAVAESEVDQAYAERRGQATEAVMEEQITLRGLTREDVREALRRELLVQKIFERDVVAKVNVAEAEVDAFFNSHRARFNLAESQYRLAQIVVTPQRNAEVNNRMKDDAATPDAARRKIEGLVGQLKGGADFAQVAADYSEDAQSAPQGGDLGFVPESALAQAPAAMRDVVLKMEPGNVNTLMMGGTYTIVLLVAKEPAGQRELSSPGVREQIRDGLRERRLNLLRAAYIATARSSAMIDHRIARSVVDRQSAVPGGVLPAPGK